VKYTGDNLTEDRFTTPVGYAPNLVVNTKSIQEQEGIHRESRWVKYANAVPVSRLVEGGLLWRAFKIVGPFKNMTSRIARGGCLMGLI
jgi:hypothetical protein